MNPEELLQELEPLTHDQRTVRMIELGRAVKQNGAADVAATLDALEQGGFYERRLALVSCFSSYDGAQVLRYLEDPSHMLRGLALRLVAVVCDDAEVLIALKNVPVKMQQRLLKRLLKRRRHAAIDGYLESLAAGGEANLDRLLAYGSAQFVAPRADTALAESSIEDWARLARFHPSIAAGALEKLAGSTTARDNRLISRASVAMPSLADHDAERALALVEVLSRHASLARLNIQRLAERAPAAVIDLMMVEKDIGPVSFQSVFAKLDTERVLWLLEHQPQPTSHLQGWLNVTPQWLSLARKWRRLPAELRAAIYEHSRFGWRDADGVIGRDLLAHLAREPREAEGHRHLALPALATRPAQRLPYAALLPWAEAVDTLTPFIRNPDPDLRTVALSSLIFAARYHRDRLPELLEMILARRNEQDPIRGAMLSGLAALPPSLFREEHLEALGGIVRQALDAADLSAATANAAEQLLFALLPHHSAWSTEWLTTLLRERGQLTVYHLECRLSDNDVQRLAPALLPVLQSWEKSEREMQIINFARGLGKRLAVWKELLDLLERIVENSVTAIYAEAALMLLKHHDPQRLRVLVPKLVETDPSWGTRFPVYTYLHRRRQDLLTPLLGQTAFQGRFSTGRTRWVLPLSDGFMRWTPGQQSIFAQTLGDVLQDPARDSPALLRVIKQLAALPDIEPDRLVELADERNPKLAVRDAALRALGRLDAGQGVTHLIAAMEDDRARIAIYALRRSLLEMPESRALSLLRAVPLTRVTVAKEVVRLLGELTSEEAYGQLLTLNERDLHRDIRVALLRALWDHQERNETWTILEAAASSPDPAIATMAGRIPADRLSTAAQSRLAALIATVLSHPDAKVRVDALSRCADLPIRDRGEVLLQPLLAALESPLPDEYTKAGEAVFATYARVREELIAAAVTRILPRRRALQTLVATLIRRYSYVKTVHAVLNSLEADPFTITLQIQLVVAALSPPNIVRWFVNLAETGALHADALSAAMAAFSGTPRFTLSEFKSMEESFFSSAEPSLRRLALTLLALQAGPPHGWDENRAARLERYRTDPSALVAAAAQFTFVPDA